MTATKDPPMATVTRLPVRHRTAPHCSNCGVALPSFGGLELTFSSADFGGHTVTAVVLKITCRCGMKWSAKKIL